MGICHLEQQLHILRLIIAAGMYHFWPVLVTFPIECPADRHSNGHNVSCSTRPPLSRLVVEARPPKRIVRSYSASPDHVLLDQRDPSALMSQGTPLVFTPENMARTFDELTDARLFIKEQ